MIYVFPIIIITANTYIASRTGFLMLNEVEGIMIVQGGGRQIGKWVINLLRIWLIAVG